MELTTTDKVIMAASLLLILVVAGTMDFTERSNQDANYCRMVEMHQDTDGEFGWPDFDNKYKELC